MKIKLLSGEAYCGMELANFPAEVEACKRGELYIVHERELARIGCDMSCIDDPEDPYWPFCENEVEVIHES